MGISVNGSTASGTTVTTASATSAASGSTFLIGVSIDNPSTMSTPTDSKGNTYTLVGVEINSAAGLFKSAVYKCENGVGGAGHTASVAITPANTISLHLFEVDGGTPIVDVSNQGTDNASPWQSPSVTQTYPLETLVSYITTDGSTAGTFTAQAGMTKGASFIDSGVTVWPSGFASVTTDVAGGRIGSWTDTSTSANAAVHIIALKPTSTTFRGGYLTA
jgi:hypothetical protein